MIVKKLLKTHQWVTTLRWMTPTLNTVGVNMGPLVYFLNTTYMVLI